MRTDDRAFVQNLVEVSLETPQKPLATKLQMQLELT